MKYVNCTQGSDAWHLARAGLITASRFSDARSKLKKSSGNGKPGDPSGAAIEYAWAVAIERVAGKPIGDVFETWQMRRGTQLEPHARMAYESATGNIACESGIALTDDGLFGYSSDGLVSDDGMIEIKCPAAYQKIGNTWANPEHAADEYIDQIMGGMWITNRKWCDLVIYCPSLEPVGKETFIKRIDRDDDYIEELEADLWQFKLLVDQYEAKLREKAA